MKISYAITVKDELVELDRLLFKLKKSKRDKDEIVIVYDSSNGSTQVEQYLKAQTVSESPFRWHSFEFKNNFSELKNYITKQCTGDYIFQIDADEFPNEYLISILPTILESNAETEVYLTPRVNTVEGLTEAHIQKWGWRVDEKGWVNYPDYQWRIWKNKPEIKWVNKVHERLDGFKTYVALPPQEEFSLYHPKDIERQERQNQSYEKITHEPKYFIYSPGYNPKSGGITVLHKLCHLLNKKGVETYLYPMHLGQNNTNKEWETSFSTAFNPSNDIVIYPEIVVGNPLGAKKVIRYVLNNPRPIEKQWGEKDTWVFHNKFFYNYTYDLSTHQSQFVREGEPDNYLHIIETRKEFFQNLNKFRKGTCYTLRKGEEKGYKPTHNLENSKEINYDISFEELREVFNTTEKFYSYDTCTYISTLAALCGCISIVIPEEGLDKEIWRAKNPAFKYGVAYGEDDIQYALDTMDKVRPYLEKLEKETEDQLIKFIDLTKSL